MVAWLQRRLAAPTLVPPAGRRRNSGRAGSFGSTCPAGPVAITLPQARSREVSRRGGLRVDETDLTCAAGCPFGVAGSRTQRIRRTSADGAWSRALRAQVVDPGRSPQEDIRPLSQGLDGLERLGWAKCPRDFPDVLPE